MSNRQITIAIDAMGGENSPYKILKIMDEIEKGFGRFRKRAHHQIFRRLVEYTSSASLY